MMWWYVGISSVALVLLLRGTGSPQLPPIPAATERHVNDEPLPEHRMPSVSPKSVISNMDDMGAWDISTSSTFQEILS